MNTSSSLHGSGQDLLARMKQIPVIVQGKLSERHRGTKVTGHKLQCWRHGRNQTRHISAAQLETVRRGTEGYAEFQRLAQRYVELREQEAFHGGADSKKKSMKR